MFPAAECANRSTRSSSRCFRSSSTSSTNRSHRWLSGSSGIADSPVPRLSSNTSRRYDVSPPRSPRYSEARPGPPGTQTSTGPSPMTWYASSVPSYDLNLGTPHPHHERVHHACPASVELDRVHAVDQRYAVNEAGRVGCKELGDLPFLVRVDGGAMRADQDVGQGPQRAGRIERLVFEHVQGGVSDPPVLECLDHLGLVDRVPAAHIDERRTRAQAAQGLPADDVVRLIGRRQTQHYGVRQRQRIAELIHAQDPRHLSVDLPTVYADNRGTECRTL